MVWPLLHFSSCYSSQTFTRMLSYLHFKELLPFPLLQNCKHNVPSAWYSSPLVLHLTKS